MGDKPLERTINAKRNTKHLKHGKVCIYKKGYERRLADKHNH